MLARKVNKFWQRLTENKYLRNKRVWAISGFMALFAVGTVALLPRDVAFSFSKQTCVREFVLLPSHSKGKGESFAIEHTNTRGLFGYPLVSTKTCFTPVAAPKQGTYSLGRSLSFLPSRNYSVGVGQAPTLNVQTLDKPVAASRPLKLALSEHDEVFDYKISANGLDTPCNVNTGELSCDLEQLRLKQSSTYQLSLDRTFDGRPVDTVVDRDLKTLRAVSIKGSSIKNKQIVYTKPKSIELATTKPVTSGEIRLLSVDGKEVETQVKFDQAKVILSFSKELPRKAEYRLEVARLVATDGSDIDKPFTLNFSTSGGPKPTAVNIGQTSVPRGSTVIVQLDQPLKPGQNLANFVSVTGGVGVTLSGQSLVFSTSSYGRCQNFTITIKPGLISKYGVKNDEAWRYSSRTLCYDVGVVGYSVNGAPINAYYFGSSGPTTLYVGAIHGDEASSMHLMNDWVSELERNANQIGNNRVVVIPKISPDGVANGSRFNSRGVNLNRNFPTSNWVSDINDVSGMKKGGGGKAPLSEPEAAALASITASLRPRLVMSFHSQGSFTIGTGSLARSYAARYANSVGYADLSHLGNGAFDYSVTGAYEDWTYEKLGVPSVLVELGNHSYVDISHHRTALWSMIK